MIAGVCISQETLGNGILTALKPSLEHDRKLALRLLRLYGDQALIYSNCKLVYSRRHAAFLVINNTPLRASSMPGGGHSHIGSYLGCAARMGEFSRPKTCGWV